MENIPTLKELNCLTGFPEGSRGYQEERLLLATLLALCEQHGFGRVHQLTGRIESLLRDPEIAKTFEKERQDRFRIMAHCAEGEQLTIWINYYAGVLFSELIASQSPDQLVENKDWTAQEIREKAIQMNLPLVHNIVKEVQAMARTFKTQTKGFVKNEIDTD